MKLSRFISTLLTLVLLFSLFACSSTPKTDTDVPASGQPTAPSETKSPAEENPTETAAPKKSSKDVVSYNIAADPERLGLALLNASAGTINPNVYARLAYVDAKGNLMLDAAKSIERDGITYNVEIRDDLYCSDGHHITAEDVAWCFRWTYENSPSAASTSSLDLETLEVTGDYTFKVSLKDNIANFKALQSLWDCLITWEGAVEKDNLAPAGTGPYKLVEWQKGTLLKLEPNEYWYGEPPYISTVYFKVIREDAQKVNALMAGELDFVSALPAADYEYVKNDDNYQIAMVPGFISQAVFFNYTDNSVMSNKTVRQAVAYAIDNESIIDIVYGGVGNNSIAPVSTGLLDFQNSWASSDYYSFNLAKAKELFASAGIDWSKETIVIATDGSSAFNTTAQIIQDNLRECGVTARIENYEAASYGSTIKDTTTGWDIFLRRITCASGYTCDLLNAFLGATSLNYSGWSNQEFTDLVTGALGDYENVGLANTAQAIEMVKDLVPMYSYMEQVSLFAYVKGLNISEVPTLVNNVERMDKVFFE